MHTIAELLTEGKENAITGRELCEVLKINGRELMIAVEQERRAGTPICASTSDPPGYYLARNKHEMKEYCDSLYRRGGNLFKTRRACLEAIDKLPGTIEGPCG